MMGKKLFFSTVIGFVVKIKNKIRRKKFRLLLFNLERCYDNEKFLKNKIGVMRMGNGYFLKNKMGC